MMPVTPGHDLGIYGPDKDGVDWAFGSFNETAMNDFQENVHEILRIACIKNESTPCGLGTKSPYIYQYVNQCDGKCYCDLV